MKAANKIVKVVVLGVVIVLVILVAGLYLFGGHLVKIGVEKAATKTLGVGVDIDDVDISIFKGSVEIDGLMVENPAGYAHKYLLELGQGRVAANISSMLGDIVQIKELKLDGINLVIEQKGLSNNLQDVIESISAEGEGEPSGKKLRIDELEITNVKVQVKLLPVPGKADTVTLNLAPIKMRNLGTDNKLSIGRLAGKIMLAIGEGVAKDGVEVLPKEIVNTMKSTLEKAVDWEKAAKEGEKLIEEGKDAGKELIEGFKGLLKTKKSE